MHEFTDGCAAQYKSRHCIGELSCCVADFGFPIRRNYFETSHAKGEQDAAGSHVKQQASLAVIRGRADITNAKQLCDHLTANFSLPAQSSFPSRSTAVDIWEFAGQHLYYASQFLADEMFLPFFPTGATLQ